MWPLAGRSRFEFGLGIRSVPLSRVVIFYRLAHDDAIEILRIIDGRRDLGTITFSELSGSALSSAAA